MSTNRSSIPNYCVCVVFQKSRVVGVLGQEQVENKYFTRDVINLRCDLASIDGTVAR